MKITLRIAHQAKRPDYCLGKTFKKGDQIGQMGETGISTAAHVHIDNCRGIIKRVWKLKDAETGRVSSDPKELNRFIIPELFGGSIRVTTPYADYAYQLYRGKLHLAYDVSTDEPWPWKIYWPIEEEGCCEAVLFDDAYGWVSLISYEVKERV